MKPTIDPEFRDMIPPLTADELATLTEQVKRDGCTDSLKVWRSAAGDVLLDGHNRLTICEANNIAYRTEPVGGLTTRDDAKVWIIHNQLGRRNLSPMSRCELVESLKPLLAEKAKANERAGGGDQTAGFQKSGNPLVEVAHTDKSLAALAGVSHDTIHKARVLMNEAPEDVKSKLRRGETKINTEYRKLRGDPAKAPKPKPLTPEQCARAKELIEKLQAMACGAWAHLSFVALKECVVELCPLVEAMLPTPREE